MLHDLCHHLILNHYLQMQRLLDVVLVGRTPPISQQWSRADALTYLELTTAYLFEFCLNCLLLI